MITYYLLDISIKPSYSHIIFKKSQTPYKKLHRRDEVFLYLYVLFYVRLY